MVNNTASQTFNYDIDTQVGGIVSPIIVIAAMDCMCMRGEYLYTNYLTVPIHFTNSTAVVTNNCTVAVKWNYETTNTYAKEFVIERSSNGIDYQTIGKVLPQINVYNDAVGLDGKWFYRIKSIDINNVSSYSKSMVVVTQKCVSISRNIYPNPASKQLQVAFKSPFSSIATFKIVDAIGSKIQEGLLYVNGTKIINLKTFAAGTYHLIATHQGIVTTKIFTIIK